MLSVSVLATIAAMAWTRYSSHVETVEAKDIDIATRNESILNMQDNCRKRMSSLSSPKDSPGAEERARAKLICETCESTQSQLAEAHQTISLLQKLNEVTKKKTTIKKHAKVPANTAVVRLKIAQTDKKLRDLTGEHKKAKQERDDLREIVKAKNIEIKRLKGRETYRSKVLIDQKLKKEEQQRMCQEKEREIKRANREALEKEKKIMRQLDAKCEKIRNNAQHKHKLLKEQKEKEYARLQEEMNEKRESDMNATELMLVRKNKEHEEVEEKLKRLQAKLQHLVKAQNDNCKANKEKKTRGAATATDMSASVQATELKQQLVETNNKLQIAQATENSCSKALQQALRVKDKQQKLLDEKEAELIRLKTEKKASALSERSKREQAVLKARKRKQARFKLRSFMEASLKRVEIMQNQG